MATTSYTDMDSHQQLMAALQNAADKCLEASDKATTALEALTEHNGDGLAHADLRATIARMGTVSLSDVDNRITQHSENTTAHQDIRDGMNTINENLGSVRQTIFDQIDTHNNSTLAHSDIRAAINGITSQIGELNYTALKSQVDALGEEITENIADSIAALKTKDAQHDNKIAINIANIASIQDSLNQNSNVALALASGSIVDVEAADALKAEVAAHKYQVEAGLPVTATNGCSFLGMQTTLPPYVKAGNHSPAVTFTITGVTPAASGNQVKLKVSAVNTAKLTMSPNTEQDNGATFSITKVNEVAGEPVLIKVQAIDKTTNVSVYKIISFVVTTPLNAENIILKNMPYNVNLGGSYSFTIDNLVDNDNDRYTYAIDSNSTGINFTASYNNAAADISNLKNGSVVNFTVPTNLTANAEYSFKINATDAYNGTSLSVKTIFIKINPIAGAETFSISAPSIVVPGKFYYVSWSGLTNENCTNVKIVNADPSLTFSDTGATEGILDGAQIKMTVKNTAPRGTELPFQITYKDSEGVDHTLNESVIVNTLPDASSVNCTLTTASGDKIAGDDLAGGLYSNKQTVKFRLDGGTDIQSGAQITYELACTVNGVTFSKSAGIAANATITMTIPKVDRVTAAVLKVTVRDSTNELSEAKEFAFNIDPIYVTSKPRITSPANNYKYPYASVVKLVFTNFAYSVNLS